MKIEYGSGHGSLASNKLSSRGIEIMSENLSRSGPFEKVQNPNQCSPLVNGGSSTRASLCGPWFESLVSDVLTGCTMMF